MKGLIESFGVFKNLNFAKWEVLQKHNDLSVFGFPCYLKVDVAEGEHKTELGAVVKCSNLSEAEMTLINLHKRFPNNQIIVQENVEGIEMIVGIKTDEVFGKILVVGFGGIFAEIKKDVSFRVFPVSLRDIKQMVSELEGFGVFFARGKKYNLEKFYSLIERVVKVVQEKKISELDLNPVIISEKNCWIVDARVN